MFEHIIEVRENAHEIFSLDPSKAKSINRALSKPFKKAYAETARLWYRKFFPRHFKRQASFLYPEAFPKRVRSKKIPMVKTGALRDRVLALSHPKITSTGNGVRIRIPYGRPSNLTEEEMHIKTLRLMKAAKKKGQKLEYDQAKQIAFSNAGFSKEIKDGFQQKMTAINPREEKEMAEFLVGVVGREINLDTKFRKWRVKA